MGTLAKHIIASLDNEVFDVWKGDLMCFMGLLHSEGHVHWPTGAGSREAVGEEQRPDTTVTSKLTETVTVPANTVRT